MKTKIITKDLERQEINVVFEMEEEDTCMREWYFEVHKHESERRIVNSSIIFSKQGCNGHPKTISALVEGRSIESINTHALMKTKCFRNQSCGMTLARCITDLLINDELQFERR